MGPDKRAGIAFTNLDRDVGTRAVEMEPDLPLRDVPVEIVEPTWDTGEVRLDGLLERPSGFPHPPSVGRVNWYAVVTVCDRTFIAANRLSSASRQPLNALAAVSKSGASR
jgi:hypothetical protein